MQLLEVSVPARRSHRNLYLGGLVLAFFLGMALSNGMATFSAINEAYQECHQTLLDAQQRPSNRPPQQ